MTSLCELCAQGEVATWLVGECVSFGQTIPFLPLVDQLRRNFGIEELDGEPEIIAKVEHGMRRIGELEAHIPFIRFLLSVDPGDPTVAAMDPLLRRKKIFVAGRMLTVRGARRRPLVLVFEDLHWMDSSTEEYLGTLMDSIRGAPILLILTHRVGYAPPFGTRSFHTTLNLQPLSKAEVATMAGRVLGTGALSSGMRHWPRVAVLGGGVMIEAGGSIVAGIGVSGAPSGESDDVCARAGIKAIADSLEF